MLLQQITDRAGTKDSIVFPSWSFKVHWGTVLLSVKVHKDDVGNPWANWGVFSQDSVLLHDPQAAFA